MTYTDCNKIWMVPRATNSFHTERTELAKRLTQLFSINPSRLPKQRRTFVIFGLGGTGKSEVCLRFAEDHRHEYANAGSLANIALIN